MKQNDFYIGWLFRKMPQRFLRRNILRLFFLVRVNYTYVYISGDRCILSLCIICPKQVSCIQCLNPTALSLVGKLVDDIETMSYWNNGK